MLSAWDIAGYILIGVVVIISLGVASIAIAILLSGSSSDIKKHGG